MLNWIYLGNDVLDYYVNKFNQAFSALCVY